MKTLVSFPSALCPSPPPLPLGEGRGEGAPRASTLVAPQKARSGSDGTPRRPSSRSQCPTAPRASTLVAPQKARSGSDGTPRRPSSRSQSPTAPRAFTLVELLVVIGIIGLLAALLTPVVMQSLTKARNAAIKAEIDMLHMAIMNYKNEYGSFPPAISSLVTGSSAAKHLGRLFPRCPKDSTINSGTNVPQQLLAAFPATASPKTITSTNALTYWLSGFTDDPMQPLVGSRKKLFDFDMSRVDQVSGAYYPSGKSGSPYIYVTSSQYATNVYSGVTEAQLNNYGAQCIPPKPLPPKPSPPPPDAWYFTAAAASPVTPQAFNADTFQILCAGRDEQFGTDDDLSNFWPGTRREYLDSLKD